MITRRHRFHGYGGLNYVYKHGKTARDTLCSLRYIENSRRNSYRVAVVVSKKVNKSAVKRNRLRRRIYEIIRQHGPAITKPYDLVISVFSEELNNLDHKQLFSLITDLLKKADVI